MFMASVKLWYGKVIQILTVGIGDSWKHLLIDSPRSKILELKSVRQGWEDWSWQENARDGIQKNTQIDPMCLSKSYNYNLPPPMLSIDWIWFLTPSCASSWCGGRSGSVCLCHGRGSLLGTEGVHKRLMIDWLIGKRKIWVWRTDCQFQMVPWGRTGGDPGISAPEKPQAVNYMHQAMLRRDKVEGKKNQEVTLLECVGFVLFSSHLCQFAGSSQSPHTIPRMSVPLFMFQLWLK